MIDIENKVYTEVKNVLPVGTNTSSVRVAVPSAFPHVAIIQDSCTVHMSTRDIAKIENHADVLFTIEIYSTVSKAECKSLASTADTKMSSMGFTRTFSNAVENIDGSVYRYVLRYEAIVSAGRVNGTTTTHLIQ